MYPDWAQFEKFAREEDVRWVLEEHQAKGFPADQVTERFRRFSKLLVWVEPSDLPVVPTWGYDTRPDGKVTVDRQRVDRNGRLDLIAETQGWYLLSAVVLEPSVTSVMLETGALWESLWASTTFAVQSISH